MSLHTEVPTFLVAGHETTSTETMWCLFALAQRPHIQSKLRAELLAVPTDTPEMDDLMALPYLDMVVRETLRLHAPVPSTMRVAINEDVIPLNEPVTDRNGEVHNHIKYASISPASPIDETPFLLPLLPTPSLVD